VSASAIRVCSAGDSVGAHLTAAWHEPTGSSATGAIIDEFVAVLPRHCGFTVEDFDFIINCDIKYRRGRESEGDE